MSDPIAFEVRRCDHICESDGTISLMIKIDPGDAIAFLTASPEAGGSLFVAPGVRKMPEFDPLKFTLVYGNAATMLAEADTFGHPGMWEAAGSDADFLSWIRTESCWIRQLPGHVCAGQVVAAHVRRINRGAGMGIKPTYSAVPLCDRAHQDQHNHGESAIGGRARVDLAAARFIRRWCSRTILAAMNAENWFHVPPARFRDWATDRSVAHLLPADYRRGAK